MTSQDIVFHVIFERIDNMNTSKRAVEIVVDALKQHGIHYIVISPGGTNRAFIRLVQDDPFFKCYSVVDERSAMYFAIGLYLQTGEIIATSCTSAQATRNYLPGLTEAFYKHVPILAITMQKLERFIGQEYMQAPDQSSLPVDAVKKSYVMPYVNDINSEYHAVRVANEAILELTHNGTGPVQICLQWLDFPLSTEKAKMRTINRYTRASFPDIGLNGKKVLLVIGEHRPFLKEEISAIESFCRTYDCAVYVNHLSNYHGEHALDLNCMFYSISLDTFIKEGYAPDIIITIGGYTGDYPLYMRLSDPELEDTEHWRVSEDGNCVDTYDKLTKVFQCGITEFFSHYSQDSECAHPYFEKLKAFNDSRKLDIAIPFSNAYAAQKMSGALPDNTIIQFSILHSLRVWSLFPLNESIQCYCNVGAFGIDGGMSTFLGQSVVTDNLCLLVIGDLAFYYDMNALGIRHIKNNVRILLVNNNGGVEFKLNNEDYKSIDRFIAASDHFKNAEGWSNTCGYTYLSARSKEEFDLKVEDFLKPSDSPILFELFVSDKDDYHSFSMIRRANLHYGIGDYVKKGIKKGLSIIKN